jgi:ankyrin repeat protein
MGWSALLLACARGRLDVARWLVTHAGSDARSEQNDVSCPLLCSRTSAAGLYRRLSSCECARLVGCGAFPCQPREELRVLLLSQGGDTALSIACSRRHWSVARWLIDEQDVELVRLGVAAASSVSSASEC